MDSFHYTVRKLKQPMNATRHRHVAVDLGKGRIGVFGGFGKMDALLLDLTSESFRALACKESFGDFHGIALAGGKALLVNGQVDSVFDPATEQFTRTSNQFAGKYARWPGMVALPDGKVFLCGGYDGEFRPLDHCAVFDPKTLRFEAVGKLTEARCRHSVNLLSDSQILIAGGAGADYTRQAFDSVEIFDLKTGSSKRLSTTLRQARAGHCSVALANGTILLVGGYSPARNPSVLRTTELFDPVECAVSAAADMALARSDPQAVRLPSGRVAVFGGYNDLRTVEIYDLTTKEFLPADQLLIEPRASGFTTTRLENGDVVLIGGRVNSSAKELDGAEVFSERKTPPLAKGSVDARQLARDLGDSRYTVREAATRKLIALGINAKPFIEPLLKHEDPEVRHRAETILDAVRRSTESAPWCVELWDDDTKKDTVWFSDSSSNASAEDVRLQKLNEQLAKGPTTKLVVRFAATASKEQQTQLLNLVGWSNFPVVVLGEPLASE